MHSKVGLIPSQLQEFPRPVSLSENHRPRVQPVHVLKKK